MNNTRNISKRIIALALAFVLIVTMFVGCGKKEPVNTDVNGSNNVSQSDENTVSEEPTVSTNEDDTDTISQTENDGSTSAEGEATTKNGASEPTTKKNEATTNKAETTTKKSNPSTGSSSGGSSSGSGSSNKTTTTTNASETACFHNWGEWKDIRLGTQERVCSKCGRTEERDADNAKAFMGNKSEYIELLNLINTEREKKGLIPFAYKSEWQAGADQRAVDLTKSFSHTRPDGRRATTAYTDLGYNCFSAGENIARGYNTPKAVYDGWMNSESHRAALMANGDEQLEVVIARCDNYWVISFLVY